MNKRDRVLRGLEVCRAEIPSCNKCPYIDFKKNCVNKLHEEALEELKNYQIINAMNENNIVFKKPPIYNYTIDFSELD